jgi:ribonuclease P protein component
VNGKLRSRRQFNLVYEQGRKAVGRHVIVFALPRAQPLAPGDPAASGGVASGIVASRKVGPAVRRNRAKRVVRVALQILRSELRRPLWIVLVARASAAKSELRSQDVTTDLREQLSRLDLLGADGSPPC